MKALLLVVYTGLAIFLGYNTLTAEEYVYRNEQVYVVAGDTMWDIAAQYRRKDEDIREVVMRISQENKLLKGMLQPGQILQVPVRVQINDDYRLAQRGKKNFTN